MTNIGYSQERINHKDFNQRIMKMIRDIDIKLNITKNLSKEAYNNTNLKSLYYVNDK